MVLVLYIPMVLFIFQCTNTVPWPTSTDHLQKGGLIHSILKRDTSNPELLVLWDQMLSMYIFISLLIQSHSVLKN